MSKIYNIHIKQQYHPNRAAFTKQTITQSDVNAIVWKQYFDFMLYYWQF